MKKLTKMSLSVLLMFSLTSVASSAEDTCEDMMKGASCSSIPSHTGVFKMCCMNNTGDNSTSDEEAKKYKKKFYKGSQKEDSGFEEDLTKIIEKVHKDKKEEAAGKKMSDKASKIKCSGKVGAKKIKCGKDIYVKVDKLEATGEFVKEGQQQIIRLNHGFRGQENFGPQSSDAAESQPTDTQEQ